MTISDAEKSVRCVCLLCVWFVLCIPTGDLAVHLWRAIGETTKTFSGVDLAAAVVVTLVV